jgi:hypothetical protein
MTSNPDPVARIMVGLQDVVDGYRWQISDANAHNDKRTARKAEEDLAVALECLAVAQAQRLTTG